MRMKENISVDMFYEIWDFIKEQFSNLRQWVHWRTHTHHEIMKPGIGKIMLCAGKWKWNYKGIAFAMYPEFKYAIDVPPPYILKDVNPEEQQIIYDSTNLVKAYIEIRTKRNEAIQNEIGRLE